MSSKELCKDYMVFLLYHLYDHMIGFQHLRDFLKKCKVV